MKSLLTMISFVIIIASTLLFNSTNGQTTNLLKNGDFEAASENVGFIDILEAASDATSVKLHWVSCSDTQMVTEYRILRNNLAIGSTIGKHGYFTDYGLLSGTSYAYLIEGLNMNGDVICKSNTIQVATKLHSTIRTRYNLLAIVFNPNGETTTPSELNHIRTFLKYRIDFLRNATHNSVNLDVYTDDIVIINAYPPLRSNTQEIDYKQLASTAYPELSDNAIVDLIERYDVDIVWVLGAPQGYNFAENILMGNYNLGNNTWVSTKIKCSRSFFIHSNSADARAFDAAAHHVEGTMTSATEKSPSNWPRDKEYLVYTKDRSDYSVYSEKLNLFEQFRLTDEWTGVGAYASKENANCGSSHFVPGSIRNSVNYPDYTYYDIAAWQRYVDCYADDWLNYPKFLGTPRKINGYDFNAFNIYDENGSAVTFAFGTASFHYWWFNHIPHNPGVTDGKLNNWWPYIYDCNRFDGSPIGFTVAGFPDDPNSYNTILDEYGTEESGVDSWGFWHTQTDFGQRADLSVISKEDNPQYVKIGNMAIKVDVDLEYFSINGRNDLIYPRYKNAHWNFSDADSITFSVKFPSHSFIQGTNPIIRLCKNGNNRIEYVPKKDGLYFNMFNDIALKDIDGWYTFCLPVRGNDSWEKNVIGYIDPSLNTEEQEQARQGIIQSILNDVNYFEISIQTNGTSGVSLVYYVDNLKIHYKKSSDFTVDKLNACIREEITFSVTTTLPVTGLLWNFGEGAIPVNATGPGPHSVYYETAGSKTIVLTTNETFPLVKKDYVTVRPNPEDKYVVAEYDMGCDEQATNIIVLNYEPGIQYLLRNDEDNSPVAGSWPGYVGLYTGVVTETTTYNVLATNPDTGCESVMITKPTVTINPTPLDKYVVAEYPNGPAGHATNIIVINGQPDVLYELRNDADDSSVAGPWTGSVGLYTSPLYETTTFNVLAFYPTTACETEMSTRVTVTIDDTILSEKDVNSRTTHEDVSKTAAELLDNVVNIYPNPSRGVFNLVIRNEYAGSYNLLIHGFAGNIVTNEVLEKTDQIYQKRFELSKLPQGTYIISIIKDNDEPIARERLLIIDR